MKFDITLCIILEGLIWFPAIPVDYKSDFTRQHKLTLPSTLEHKPLVRSLYKTWTCPLFTLANWSIRLWIILNDYRANLTCRRKRASLVTNKIKRSEVNIYFCVILCVIIVECLRRDCNFLGDNKKILCDKVNPKVPCRS